MEMRHTAGEVCLFVIRAENIPPTTCQSINLEAVLYFCTAEDPPPIPHTHTHVTEAAATSSHSQRSRLPENAAERVNFPPHKREKKGLLLIIFDCEVRRVSVVKMLIFSPNRKTRPG